MFSTVVRVVVFACYFVPDLVVINTIMEEFAEKTCELCRFCSRLSKNILRLSCAGNKSRGSLLRRMNSAPVQSEYVDKENTIRLQNKTISPLRLRVPLEDCDQNSQDSGYNTEDTNSTFRFAEPNGFPPKKSYIEPSPHKKPPSSPLLNCDSSPNIKLYERKSQGFSFSSNDSFDDGFLELGDLDKPVADENDLVPVGLGDLLTGQLLSGKERKEDVCEKSDNTKPARPPPFRRCLSMIENVSSPATSKMPPSSFIDGTEDCTTPTDRLSFKRPRCTDLFSSKRRKSNSMRVISEHLSENIPNPRYKLQRSVSESASVALANQLNKSYSSNDLIADYSQPYILPIISGHHEDLKSISSETLASLLSGEYCDRVQDYKIIDCRYPYEYEGGHIAGASNCFTKEQIQQVFFGNSVPSDSFSTTAGEKRKILIFHCEYSKERGPNMFRFLRQYDRSHNSYPSLQYPEMYLLHGGYKTFFAKHQHLCEPQTYLPMADPKFESDLRKFRFKSQSWNSSTFKRLAL